jgi:hypothetical protein
MVYFGKVKDGKVELDPAVRLPEGATVKVDLVKADEPDPADDLSSEAVDMGVEDGASQHDHYIYGTPKRKV